MFSSKIFSPVISLPIFSVEGYFFWELFFLGEGINFFGGVLLLLLLVLLLFPLAFAAFAFAAFGFASAFAFAAFAFAFSCVCCFLVSVLSLLFAFVAFAPLLSNQVQESLLLPQGPNLQAHGLTTILAPGA